MFDGMKTDFAIKFGMYLSDGFCSNGSDRWIATHREDDKECTTEEAWNMFLKERKEARKNNGNELAPYHK